MEGIYLVPKNDNDIPLVDINYKRKITRQRFTAAHELCHNLKDRRNKACPKGGIRSAHQNRPCKYQQYTRYLPDSYLLLENRVRQNHCPNIGQ